MYTEYENEINEVDLLYEQPERTTDIQLSPGMNTLLLAIWIVTCLFGFAVIFLGKQPIIGTVIIAVPTFFGMVLKPTFGLCIVMLVLPTGAGVAYKEIFSLDRGIGIALAVSFLLNLLITRPRLHIRNKALWVAVIFTIWILLTSLVSPYPKLELVSAFTQFQLLVLLFLVYWILETNGEKTFRWALRSYVIGTLGTIILAYISGKAMISIEETREARYSATLGQAINANLLAVLVAMAFLTAIYLFARDKKLSWRIVHLIAILVLPLMLLRIGSRGALVAVTFTLLSPLIFLRQVLRKPALAIFLAVIIVLASASAAFILQKRSLKEGVSRRLTDIGYATESFSYRMELDKQAVTSAIRRPLGTGYYGWFELVEVRHRPHNDFFFILGIYGIPGAILFALFVVLMLWTIKRTPIGLEKLYTRAILTFLLVYGLSGANVGTKLYWVFWAFAMAGERIAYFFTEQRELLDSSEGEELVGVPTAY